MITQKQQQLINLLKGTLPTAPAEVAQNNVEWYKQWQYGEKVNIGDRRWSIAEGSTEKILYEVYTEAGDNLYPPEQVPAIYRRVHLEEWPEWVQPTGAHDAYAKGDKVTHNSKKWTSDYEANTWEPGVFGWTEVVG